MIGDDRADSICSARELGSHTPGRVVPHCRGDDGPAGAEEANELGDETARVGHGRDCAIEVGGIGPMGLWHPEFNSGEEQPRPAEQGGNIAPGRAVEFSRPQTGDGDIQLDGGKAKDANTIEGLAEGFCIAGRQQAGEGDTDPEL